MSDFISRKALCDDLREYKVHPVPISSDESEVKGYNDGIDLAISVIAEFPSAEPEPEEFEWCARGESPCKEYDQEKHCCHRWTKVIRQTVKEVKAQYALEYPEIVHCEDCKFYTSMNRKLRTGICSLTMHHLGDAGFCSDAERRKQ